MSNLLQNKADEVGKICLSCKWFVSVCRRHHGKQMTDTCDEHERTTNRSIAIRLSYAKMSNADRIKRTKAIVNSLPQCKDKNSSEFKQWKQLRDAKAPQCQKSDSTAYRAWRKNLAIGAPSRQDKNSKAFREWHARLQESLPQCTSGETYQQWYDKQTASLPQCQSTASEEYQDWYLRNSKAIRPWQMPVDSTNYKQWYAQLKDVLPQCQDVTSKEYQRWVTACPALKDRQGSAYQEWLNVVVANSPSCQDPESAAYRAWLDACPACKDTTSILYKTWADSLPQRDSAAWKQFLKGRLPQCKHPYTKEYQDWHKINSTTPRKHPTCRQGYHCSILGKNRYINSTIYYRSSWELWYMQYLDQHALVESYIWEPFTLVYQFENKPHGYNPDVLVLWKDGTKTLVEIKPLPQTAEELVLIKAASAIVWCAQNNAEFEFWG